ncbi:MAG: heavy-metal-associated domain-containing protein [Thermodesulfovibrionales bacterium]|nr:heavy-metal-associated domain-containing protein [Thermodesulfovibrionales bacterium]
MYYIHNIPGRIRIKTPEIKNNRYKAEAVKQTLNAMRGVSVQDVNLLTGSVLVHYNTAVTDVRSIIDRLEKTGYFNTSLSVTNDDYVKTAATKVGNFAAKTIFGAALDTALAGTPLALITVFI